MSSSLGGTRGPAENVEEDSDLEQDERNQYITLESGFYVGARFGEEHEVRVRGKPHMGKGHPATHG